MNWYNKIILSQIWQIKNENDTFENNIISMYELEYKLQAIKYYPFQTHWKRKENIKNKLDEALHEVMEKVRQPLVITFERWLEAHALTNPALWAEKRIDPYGYGYFDEQMSKEILDGIAYEYARYKNNNMPLYNRPNSSSLISQMLSDAFSMGDTFSSLQNLKELFTQEQKQTLMDQLAYEGPETFGESNTGTPFQTQEQAEQYIQQMVSDSGIEDYISSTDSDTIISMLDSNGLLENFLTELNQYLVFPLWYGYWRGMGIDETRENIEEIYNALINSSDIAELDVAVWRAIEATHQGGKMIDDYLYEFSNVEVDPDELRNIMDNLTKGSYNATWDAELESIGVVIPENIKQNHQKVDMNRSVVEQK